MADKNRIRLMLMIASVIALGLSLIPLIGEKWISNSLSPDQYGNFTHVVIQKRGLWVGCYMDGNCKILDKFYENDMGPKALQATRICACLGSFLFIWGFFAAVFEPYHHKIKMHHSGTQLLVGPMCWLIAMAIYTGVENPNLEKPLEWGWSFIMGWFITFFIPIFGFPLAWVALDDD